MPRACRRRRKLPYTLRPDTGSDSQPTLESEARPTGAASTEGARARREARLNLSGTKDSGSGARGHGPSSRARTPAVIRGDGP